MSNPHHLMLGGMVLLGVAASAVPASAAVMQATFEGYISEGYDYTGVFGLAGQDLANRSFNYTIIYDTDAAGAYNYSDGNAHQIIGGGGTGNTNPTISAVLTVNGYSISFDSDYSFSAFTESYETFFGQNYFQSSIYKDDGSSEYLQEYVYAYFYSSL